MEVISPNSSEHSHAAPAEEVAPGAIQEKLDALSADEPLPETYAGDQIVLLVQTPVRLFLYWNHGRDPRETLRAAFGEAAGGYRLAVRLTDLSGGGGVSLHPAPPGREQWFDVLPDREYLAEVGFYANDRPFVRILSSVTRTPRAGVAPESDSLSQFHVTGAEFARVLAESGYDAAARRLAPRQSAGDAPATQVAEGEDYELEGGDEFEEVEEARAAWSGSDVWMVPHRRRVAVPRPQPHDWLPSMTAGIQSDE